MKRRLVLPCAFALLLTSALAFVRQGPEEHVIDRGHHHLGDNATPEWTEASEQPEGARLDLTFEGRAIDGEAVLMLTQRHVDDPWHVEVNGVRVATLARGTDPADHHYVIPAGVLRDGENSLAIVPEVPTDDIVVGNIRYYEGTLREVFDLRPVVVRVRDADTGLPLPARVTVTDANDELVELFYAASEQTAVREGVVYTSRGEARLEVPPGRYHVYAVRGAEWSLGSANLQVSEREQSVDLALRREVDTRGFVACDTHIHTLTYSGHGDSSVEERMVTLAGEGVELAIATDHNHNTEYRPVQTRMGLSSWFTPVVGNEVTTPIGHLNAFPLDPADEVPPYEENDVAVVVAGCRAKGADVVILNHPRWPDHEKGPYGVIGLDHYTGDPREPWSFTFDAMELVNSQTEEEEPMLLFQDWFALLNRGESVMAVGSSDSHTVGGVVGQGRTYVRSSTDDPAAIDVDECCRNIAAGKSSVSMGIFVDLLHDGRSVMGETLPASARELELRVASPSWIHPENVAVFVDGQEVAGLGVRAVEGSSGRGGEAAATDETLRVPGIAEAIERGHDFWAVCVVTGPGVGGPWWPQVNDYTLAATNPVFFDVDGDGICSSPRRLAEAIVARTGTGAEAVEAALVDVDPAVAVQVLNLVRKAYLREAHARLLQVGAEVLDEHPELAGYLEGLEEWR